MKKKIIILICIIIIILIGVICASFLFKECKNINDQNYIVNNSQNYANTVIKKVEFDEKDLKTKIGIYLAYENFMQDYYEPEKENENVNIVDYANEAKVFIGYMLVLHNNPLLSNKPSEEQVRKAVEEFCGEHYEKYIDTSEYFMAFDGDNSYEFVQSGDYFPSGYCNSIESITEKDGKYTVTFIYSRPSKNDLTNDNLDNIQKYRKSMTFVYHEDAVYTKYQLTELSFLKGEEV